VKAKKESNLIYIVLLNKETL